MGYKRKMKTLAAMQLVPGVTAKVQRAAKGGSRKTSALTQTMDKLEHLVNYTRIMPDSSRPKRSTIIGSRLVALLETQRRKQKPLHKRQALDLLPHVSRARLHLLLPSKFRNRVL